MMLVIREATATTVPAAVEVVNDERVTSDFALAWTERRVGPMQSHRRFLDYVIDGDSFYRRHGHDTWSPSSVGSFQNKTSLPPND